MKPIQQTNPNADVPKAFADVFRSLVLALQPRAPVTGLLPVYYETLAGFDEAIWHASALKLRETSVFFPTTGEWVAMARSIARREPHYHPCSCNGRGLVRVMYHTGEPFDVGVCKCPEGTFYRRLFLACTSADDLEGAYTFIRNKLGIGHEHRIAYVEDF